MPFGVGPVIGGSQFARPKTTAGHGSGSGSSAARHGGGFVGASQRRHQPQPQQAQRVLTAGGSGAGTVIDGSRRGGGGGYIGGVVQLEVGGSAIGADGSTATATSGDDGGGQVGFQGRVMDAARPNRVIKGKTTSGHAKRIDASDDGLRVTGSHLADV